jgi:beta-1,4-N-acetylglucosaminyltransferase
MLTLTFSIFPVTFVLLLLLIIILYVILYFHYVTFSSWRTLANTAANTARDYPHPRSYRACVVAVLGSGGHTAEMIALINSLPATRYKLQALLIADSDATSLARVRATGSALLTTDTHVHTITRAREVGGSWLGAVVKSMHATISGARVLAIEQPALLLINGPGTCVPVAIAAYVLRAMGALRSDLRILFVESVCRVETLSLSGSLLYHLRIADVIAVQWETLARKFPRAQYIGTVM